MFDLSRHQQYQHELAGTPSSVAFVMTAINSHSYVTSHFMILFLRCCWRFLRVGIWTVLSHKYSFGGSPHDKFHSSVDHVSPHTQKQYIRISPISFQTGKSIRNCPGKIVSLAGSARHY